MNDPFAHDPDLVACAQIVERGDPERFAATMAAPVAARAVLFPIYAFNVEVSRAPWLTQEPLIAEMRLQWWRDALEEIEAGGFMRRHEVVTPLAAVLAGQDLRRLRALVEARKRDIETTPFAEEADLLAYLDQTAGFLAVSAAASLGAAKADFGDIMLHARAAGLARYLAAVPELEARGTRPLPDGRPEAVQTLAADRLAELSRVRSLRRLRRATGPAGAALREFWQARALLGQVARDPSCVASGRLGLSEFGRRWRLLVV